MGVKHKFGNLVSGNHHVTFVHFGGGRLYGFKKRAACRPDRGFALVGVNDEGVFCSVFDAKGCHLVYLVLNNLFVVAVNGKNKIGGGFFVGEIFAQVFFAEKYRALLHKFDGGEGCAAFYQLWHCAYCFFY